MWLLGVCTEWGEMLQEVLPSVVPEVLLSLKDPNKRSRGIAAASLEALGTLCEDNQLHCEIYGEVAALIGHLFVPGSLCLCLSLLLAQLSVPRLFFSVCFCLSLCVSASISSSLSLPLSLTCLFSGIAVCPSIFLCLCPPLSLLFSLSLRLRVKPQAVYHVPGFRV